jgi:hypothetical protein
MLDRISDGRTDLVSYYGDVSAIRFWVSLGESLTALSDAHRTTMGSVGK